MDAGFQAAFAVAANHYAHDDGGDYGRLWAALDYAADRCGFDRSTLTEVLLDATGIAAGATGEAECWQALWTWEAAHGEGEVLATLRALADATLLAMLATWQRTVDATALVAQVTAIDGYVRARCG